LHPYTHTRMGNTSTSFKRITYPSGNVYEGDVTSSNKRQGQGTLTWPDGAVYRGNFAADAPHGNGLIRFPNGSTFEGNFARGMPWGSGKLVTVNKEVMDGEFVFFGKAKYGTSRGPVGKYSFHGTITDLSTGARSNHNGPCALHLTTGLVTLPGMQDPSAMLFPFAQVVTDEDAKKFERDEDTEAFAKGQEKAAAQIGKKVLNDALSGGGTSSSSMPVARAVPAQGQSGLPTATAVASTRSAAPASSSGIAYGYEDPALQDHDPGDHGAVSILDPNLYLGMVGLNWRAPRNVREQEQREIRAAREVGSTPATEPPPVMLR